MFSIGLIEELSQRLEGISAYSADNKFVESENNEKINFMELTKCIQIHLKIRDLVFEISETFGTVLWAQGLMITVTLCMTSFSMTLVRLK